MATYEQYPTPPATSSPKHFARYQPEVPEPQSQPQSYEYSEPSPFTQPQSATAPPKIPAQDSYFHSISLPSTPIANTSTTQTQSQSQPTAPPGRRSPRRRSPPLLTGPGGVQYAQPSSLHRLSPRPLHYSPSNPVPSPYSAGRPKPRPGLLQRIARQVEQWIRAFMRWSKRNPRVAGLLTFVPVVTVVGVLKTVRGLGKRLGVLGRGNEEGYGRLVSDGEGGGDGSLGWGEGLDGDKGFGRDEGGVFEGLLKYVQMLM